MVTPNVQSLSGTYTVVFNATARAAGTNDLVDTNLNAGLDQLRGVNLTGAPTTSKTYNSTGANNNVPIVTGATDQVETESQIVITDTYLIQGATLTLNIDYPFDPDLTVSLVAPDLTTLRLFTQVGTPPPASNAGTANFVNTVFDDTGSQPIQTALAPFNLGPYNPQEPLSGLIGRSSAGTWSLNVRNTRTGAALSGSKVIKSWSLTFKQPATTTGLGEPVADQYTASFRIFTMDPSNPLAHNTWTAVGPTSINNGKSTGRVGGLAVDPSDPSGNTVFVGGASGGVWKTTNFLTTDVDGPTYVPLTNFGPTFSLNIGSIAVFARNNDPKQSIVIAATGEGDTGSRGVGFIISRDGGSTWTLLDSTQNVYTAGDVLPAGKSIGDELPIGSALRDHKFVGTSAFKVVVDPNLTNDGEVVIYAALTSGVWVSYDTGKTWGTITAQGNGSTTADTRVAQLPTTGTDQATDVSLSAGSKGSNGNLQIVYAAIKGRGVFFSQNQGQSFTQTAPVGIPYQGSNAIDGVTLDPIPVTPPAQSPNGAKGRIVLVTPFATGNPVQDFFYQSWIYAAVVTGTGAPGGPGQLDGVYVSKDFGNNWTMLNLPITSTDLPTNDYTLTTKVDPISTPMRGSLANPIPPLHPKGNFAISLGIDPTNPNIIYLGGTNPTLGAGDASLSPSTPGLIRIDATKVNDPKNLTIYDESNNDGGQFEGATSGSANGSPVYGVYQRQPNGSYTAPNTSTPYLNFTRDPENPFLASSTVKVAGIAVTGPSPGFSNDGSNATWTPFVGALGKPLTITRLRFDAMTGLATATVDSTASLINGLTVAAVIAGANPDAYNGNVTIRIVSATQFTYTPLTVPTSMTATTNTVLTVTPLTTGQHRMISYVDPLTGRGRLVFGGDQGVFTGVDDGTGGLVRLLGTNTVPTGTRNGNLQLAQFYGGATQPSLLAASIAGALFYGGSQDNGSPASAPDILQTGNLNWNPPTLGSGSDFGTDQTGSGTVYAYKWPCCNTSATAQLNQRDFFTVIRPGAVEVGAVGQNTASLIQSGDNPGTNQWPGQWPFINVFGGTGPFVNQFGASGRPIGLFTVNPIDGKSIVISSSAGRVFRTTDGGLNWFPIGNPADLDSSYAPALAFGAPSTSPGNAPGSLSNVVYAGTERGKIFATFTGGGYQGSTRWKDISAGLDGSPVQKIVTNPVRGTNELYAVTSTGVFYMADSRSDERPVGATAPTWVNITGDLLTLTHNPFNNPNLTETLLRSITSLAVDWRKQKVDSTGKARPDVYVGGTGGVFRMTTQDFGGAGTFRWQAFPSATAPSTDQSSGTARNGGLLPNVQITELELSLGNISSATGLPDQSGGPLLLVATTYGQGVFAIRVDNGLAPGPRVQSAVATNATANSTSINSVTVTFNGSVDPATFDRTDVVSLTTPDGTDITSTVTGVTDITPTPAAVTISSLTYNSGTGLVTATVGSTATLINGALVAIAGANQSAYNGNVIVRVVSGTQFTYTPVTPPAVPTATTNTSFTVTLFNQHNVYRI
ncbi:MAG: beta strand repeat-containing protein, partial [Gemmata sp.]